MISDTFVFASRTSKLAAGLVATVMFAACSGGNQHGQMPPAPVGFMKAHAHSVPLIASATGRLAAFRRADVRARVSGVLQKRTYEEGTHVDKGQQLFQIDPAPLKASLQSAKGDLAQARAKARNAHIKANRARKLVKKDYISQSKLDDAEASERTARAAVKAAKAKVKNADINLGYASVTSPIAGRASKQQVTEGALVGEGSPTLLTTVKQVDPLYVNFSLPVEKMQQLRSAQASGEASLTHGKQASIQLKTPDGNTYPHDGTLDFTDASVDASTGSVSLRGVVPNPQQALLPGMYTKLRINMGTLTNAYVLPQRAVLRDANGAYVLVVDDDNTVQRKSVTTRSMHDGTWIVTEGINDGDRIIVEGVAAARPDAEVKPHAASDSQVQATEGDSDQPAATKSARKGTSNPAPAATAA